LVQFNGAGIPAVVEVDEYATTEGLGGLRIRSQMRYRTEVEKRLSSL
jgi:hypothetical protein